MSLRVSEGADGERGMDKPFYRLLIHFFSGISRLRFSLGAGAELMGLQETSTWKKSSFCWNVKV